MHIIITNTVENDIKDNQLVLSPMYGHNLLNISEYVADSEADIIEVRNINYIPFNKLSITLTHYCRKLRLNGTIVFIGTDVYLLNKKIMNRELNLAEINNMLFGGPTVNTLHSCLVGINDIVSHTELNGLKIISKSYNGINYKLEAKRERI